MLSKLQSMREEREQGFTLVELIIVVVIIAILAAVAIPMYLNFRKGAIDSTAQSDAVNAAKQVEAYYQGSPQGLLPAAVIVTHTSNSVDKTKFPDLAGIKASAGNTITITQKGTTVGDYTISVHNDNGKKAKDDNGGLGIVYDALDGGLK